MQVSQVAELPRTAAFRVKVGRAPALHLQGWQCGAMAEAIPLVAGAVSAKGLQGERAPAEITVLVTNLHHPGGTTSPREVQNGNPSVYFGSWGGGGVTALAHCQESCGLILFLLVVSMSFHQNGDLFLLVNL